MPRFGKNVLSQFLRTKCDKQLRLALYKPTELVNLGWPEPLTARPAVQILRDVGKEWEQAKMADLEVAFGTNVRANKQNGRFVDSDLLTVLQQSVTTPAFILQAGFNHLHLKTTFLQNIGLAPNEIQLIPPFTAFRPDIVWVQTKRDDEIEVLPNGDTCTVQPNDQRKALFVCDIKHAGEANSSYSAEVVLYAVLLANWLRLVNLHGTYLTSSRMALWTRAKETSSLVELIASNPGAALSQRTQAFENDLEPVDFTIFYQTIDHFFKSDLPRVLSMQDWHQLDWHVDSRCSTCDFLGHRNWLSSPDRTKLDAHRDHYCVPFAEDSQQLSRIATITRGGRKTLEGCGHSNISAVSSMLPVDEAFEQHNALKADRSHLPHRATALLNGDVTIAPNTTTIDFPKWADLEIFISVNFDPGTGLLTALGSEARFRQKVQYGQTSQIQQTWPAEAQVLLSPTRNEERNIVISFLSRIAQILTFAYDTDPQKGGALASQTQTQLYFWDSRQFEELTKAIGRHLNAIVLPPNDSVLRGLVWLFPPEQVLQDDEITIANAVSFLKTVLQRNLRLPVPHSYTIFNVAEEYHHPNYSPHIPSSFYRDPFSDMIPRERIYEIWSGEPLIRIGSVQSTRSQCIARYSDTVRDQVAAIRNIVWKFRTDMTGRLQFAARALDIGVPFNFQGMSEDGRLWYGWARLEEACNTIELRRKWAEEPEHLEASYDTLRFVMLGEQNGNLLTYDVRPSSSDCKFRDGEDFLALQDESIPGFLGRRFRDVAPAAIYNQVSFSDRNRQMTDIFQASLLEYDRENLTATIRLGDFGSAPMLRDLLWANSLVDMNTSASLVSSKGPSISERIRRCLISIGRPQISVAAAATYGALGHTPGINPPRNDPETTAARVLWDAAALAVECTSPPENLVADALSTVINCNWPCNVHQRDAIQHCLNRRLSIVWGPPGTGKTTTAAALIVARILVARASNESLRLLITGPTYNAWEKLYNETLMLLESVEVDSVRCFRVYSASHQNHAEVSSETIEVTDADATTYDPNFSDLIQKLDNPNGIVLVGTVAHQCYRIASQGYDRAQQGLFDFAVIDESSQLDVGKALFPLCVLSDSAQVSLFGDHLQMPPIVKTEPPRDAEWLVGSIQSYLIHRYSCPTKDLLINYRAAQSFVEFGKRIGYPPNLTSYSPQLKLRCLQVNNCPPDGWNETVEWFNGLTDLADPERRISAVTYSDGRAGQANEFEADIVCRIVQQLFLTISQELVDELDEGGNPKTPTQVLSNPDSFWERGLGIVTPHRAQRALIVSRLRQIFPSHSPQKINDAVDTVERFQGGQRDTIIISFGVGDPDLIADEEEFLLQLERTNVAISRARAKCILVISDDLAYHLPSDRKTIQTSKAVKTYVSEVCRNTQQINVPMEGGAIRSIILRWQ